MAELSQDLLLSYLNARVHSQPHLRKLQGRVCVGVRRQGRTRWWIADFGPATATHFADDLPAQFDTAVAVDARTALWVLGASKQKGPMHISSGDRTLLRAFVRTYLKPNSPISIRVAGDQ